MSKKKSEKMMGTSRLASINDLDFVTSVHLNNLETQTPDGPKTVYNAIYASQLYGTMFVIYGKYQIDTTTRKDCCLVDGVNLKILNYKGLANIGFPYKKIKVGLRATENVQNIIDFSVQGFSTNYEMYIEFDRPVEVKKPGFTRIVFNRLLLALPQFGVKDQSKNDIGALKNPRDTSVPIAPFFDTEFHYRDGVAYYDEILREGMDGYDPNPDPSNKKGKYREDFEAFSFRCVQSNVNLVYY